MPDEKIPGFASRFKVSRERLGLRQADLGERLDVTGYRISNWEIGTSYPSLALFRACCTELGVSADWLLGLDPHELSAEEMQLLDKARGLGPVRLRMILNMIDHLEELRPVGPSDD